MVTHLGFVASLSHLQRILNRSTSGGGGTRGLQTQTSPGSRVTKRSCSWVRGLVANRLTVATAVNRFNFNFGILTMRYLHLFRVSSSVAAILLVAACGGGDSISSPPANPLAVTQADVLAFVSRYKEASASLEKLASPAFADTIDDGFLDGGYTKMQLQDNLAADISAVNASSLMADAAFPLIAVDSGVQSQCSDSTGICQLTVTYVNPAPDLTTTTDMVQVRKSGGKLRLFGDQRAS